MSKASTSPYDPASRPAAPARLGLLYAAGMAALLLLVAGAVLALMLFAARRSANDAGAARTSAEEARDRATRDEQEAREQYGREVGARQMAEERADRAEQARGEAERQRDEGKRHAADAEKSARAAERASEEAREARRQEQARAGVADELRKQETERRLAALRQIVKLDVAAGTRLQEAGDLPQALLWYAEALRAAAKERLPEEAHRLRLAILLTQHPKPIQAWFLDEAPRAAFFSPDGKRLLTLTADGVRSRDTATGKPAGETIKVGATPFATPSPDGKQFATADVDMGAGVVHVRLWDAATGKQVVAMDHDAAVSSAVFSADGKRLLTVGRDRVGEASLRAWDAAKGEAVGKSLDNAGRPLALAFSAGNREVLWVGAGGTLRRWNPVSGDQSGAVLDPAGGLLAAAFSPDGKRLVTGSAGGTARVWDAATGQPATAPLKHGAGVSAVEFSSDGGRLVTVDQKNVVRTWDAATGEALGGRLRHSAAVTHASFSGDGRHVLTACADGRVRLWDAASGDEVARVWQGGPVTDVTLNPAGTALLAREGKSLRLWDLTSAEPVVRAAPAAPGQRQWFSPDGKLVLRGSGTTAHLYTTDTNQPVGAALAHKYAVADAAFSADGKRVVTVCNEPKADEAEGLAQVWDTAKGEAVGPALQQVRAVSGVAISPDGRKVVAYGGPPFKARLYEADSGKQIGKDMDYANAIGRALFSPDGKYVVTAMRGLVTTWDAATGEQAGKTVTHQDAPVTLVLFSADGKRMLTADGKGIVGVWETGTGEPVSPVLDLKSAVTFAAFAPDGKRIVTGTAGGAVRVWDVKSGDPVAPPLAHAGPALAAFSPDGRWLATAAGNRFRLWDATTGEAVGAPLLNSSGPQPISYLAFTPQGKLVTGVGAAADPRGRQTWNLAPDARPVADLTELVELLAGHRLDGTSVMALAAADVPKAWDDLRPRYAADFAADPARAEAWLQRGIDECERAGNWPGVIKHLDALIAAEPARAAPLLRRAAAHKALKQWEAAVADYTKAIDLHKDRPDLWAARAALHVELSRWDKAAEDYSKAIDLKPNDADLSAARGRAYAEAGQWDKAAADFGRAAAQGREDAVTFRDQALAKLAANDPAGYKQLCVRLAKRFATSRAAAEPVGRTCALAPDALPDLKAVLQRAERALADNPKSAAHLVTVAALLYRTGQLQPALQHLEKAQALRGADDPPVDWLLLAMVQQKLGRPDEAKKALDKAAPAQGSAAAKAAPTWQARLEVALLHKEAEALVKKP